MSLLARLQDDMKTAMKSGQKERLGVIRMLISDLKTLDLQPKKISEEEAVAGYQKKLRKALEEFEKHGKAEDVSKLKGEIAIVEEYLPKKLGPQETEKLVDEFLAKNSFGEKQVGQAMGAFLKQHGGQVEAGVVNQMLRSRLAGK